MPFLKGRVTYTRFKGARNFDPHEVIERVQAHRGTDVGDKCYRWGGGESVLDRSISVEKNVKHDALFIDLVVETNKLPSDLLKAYYAEELNAAASVNPSGFATAKQKREAKEAARDRLEQEGKDGRFKRYKAIPVMWDRTTGDVLFGTTSAVLADEFVRLFVGTLQEDVTPVDAGNLVEWPEYSGPLSQVAWLVEENDKRAYGHEFLLWMWYRSRHLPIEHSIVLPFTKIATRHPHEDGGSDTFKSDGPQNMPEALESLRQGMIPTQMGLLHSTPSDGFEYTLTAHTLAVSSAKLPKVEADTPYDAESQRVGQVRSLVAAVDKLYTAFAGDRLGEWWNGWRERLSAAGMV